MLRTGVSAHPSRCSLAGVGGRAYRRRLPVRSVRAHVAGRVTKEAAMSGRVVHFEIPFDDGDRARAFYRDAFGWQAQTMPELDYTSVTSGPVGEQGMPSEPGYINGGMYQRTPDAPTSPVITIDVDDVDAALARIAELGGSALGAKLAVGDMGFAAYFTDPEGNVVGLWETAPQA
jgi:predicted enzyme related to lactoylglutathione lyase